MSSTIIDIVRPLGSIIMSNIQGGNNHHDTELMCGY